MQPKTSNLAALRSPDRRGRRSRTLTVAQTAALLDITKESTFRLIREGAIGAVVSKFIKQSSPTWRRSRREPVRDPCRHSRWRSGVPLPGRCACSESVTAARGTGGRGAR
jgi:hypothetical protein